MAASTMCQHERRSWSSCGERDKYGPCVFVRWWWHLESVIISWMGVGEREVFSVWGGVHKARVPLAWGSRTALNERNYLVGSRLMLAVVMPKN